MIIAAADGSALGNPGPAGWAWYVDDECWAAGGWPHGTNNQGELTAVLELFRATAHVDDELLIQCDSQYVINAVTKWMAGWKRKGWRKADGQPVMNREILEQLDEAIRGRRYRFEWVRGHVGHELNEAADLRARAVATAYQRKAEVPVGPGWTRACEATDAPEGAAAPALAPDTSTPSGSSVPSGASVPAEASVSPLAEREFTTDDDDALFSFQDPIAEWRTMTLELTTEEHTRLVERARAAGLTPEELLRSLI
ncbi:RNase H family protein [Agromyces aerolatus]|uniref:RNase H family protein n=1 Tax=Agromyces sp. LY-1074 TaxID=3074080 RepID=UPI00285D6A4D|nr:MULTISPECIES: RNase H family protein [unclassified Agromyces]MDR5698824.1 RNase H family protein [Agromyces sp. LY-1074]MDR5705398.1 RNase H family protein [Agromyces sp. LY-1358]